MCLVAMRFVLFILFLSFTRTHMHCSSLALCVNLISVCVCVVSVNYQQFEKWRWKKIMLENELTKGKEEKIGYGIHISHKRENSFLCVATGWLVWW